MKFWDIPYNRPDVEAVKGQIAEMTRRMENAGNAQEAEEAFRAMDAVDRELETQRALAYIRHSIDTRDEFYDQEVRFWNQAGPEIQEYVQSYNRALLGSTFRAQLAETFGDVVFRRLELEDRSFSPEIIPYMQQENDLVQEYDKLIASAQIPFEGGVYTLAQLAPFKTDPDDDRRLAAWKAEGAWYKEHQGDLDRIYDQLVHLRDSMGRALGGKDFIELGYDRMSRTSYRKGDVEKFRRAVQHYIVPLADKIEQAQAARIGVPYPMSFSDMALKFRSGNPRPAGGEEEIVAAGQKFYDALSPETGAFFKMMREEGLMDLTSRTGKESGGYCEGLPARGVPFIFANFNGTQSDVETVTHEAGHAFAYYMNRDRVPMSAIWPSLEGCEVHSMSMEFFAWPWAEDFFGGDASKYKYSHLADALTFIPYGTMVDHFQHIIYEKPQMKPAERHETWKKLMGIYMPWVRLDGEIPFYGEGEGWQRQSHIYDVPFYYIDYCLAQAVSLQFWAMIQSDMDIAWDTYMAYTEQGGSAVFTELLENAGLVSPFDEVCMRGVAKAASGWLEAFDQDLIQ